MYKLKSNGIRGFSKINLQVVNTFTLGKYGGERDGYDDSDDDDDSDSDNRDAVPTVCHAGKTT